MKILNSLWFHYLGGPLLGIVDVDFEHGEGRECFIGVGIGQDEKMDAALIAQTGARFCLPADSNCLAAQGLVKTGERLALHGIIDLLRRDYDIDERICVRDVIEILETGKTFRDK